jgi:adenylate kinase family enzyme
MLSVNGETLKKIAIIGNGGGGKTTLARKLAQKLSIPAFHVDSLQFLKGHRWRPVEEVRPMVESWALETQWIIDGFGPLDSIEHRFLQADKIIFIVKII